MGEERRIGEDPPLRWALYTNLEIIYRCRDCTQTFETEQEYIRHFKEGHNYDIKVSNGGEQK